MGSGKSGKNRRRQKQNSRARRLARARQEHSPAEPDDLLLALARLAGYTRGASTFEEAAAAARIDVMSAVDQIAQLSVGRSVSQVVQGVRTAMVFTAMGADGAYDPPAAHLELVALVLVCRDAVRPPSGDAGEADPGFNPEDVRVAAGSHGRRSDAPAIRGGPYGWPVQPGAVPVHSARDHDAQSGVPAHAARHAARPIRRPDTGPPSSPDSSPRPASASSPNRPGHRPRPFNRCNVGFA